MKNNYSAKYLGQSLDNLFIAYIGSVIPFALIYLFFHYWEKIKNLLISKKPILILYTLGYAILMTVTFCFFFNNVFSEKMFSWLPLTTTLIIITLITVFIVKGTKNIVLDDKLFFLIAIAASIASLKSYFSLNTHLYGTFMFPLVLLVNVIFDLRIQ